MKVYYGSKYKNHYIMCTDFNEIYSFDMFGNLESKVGSVASCDYWMEVDCISLVGVGNSCEIMFNGQVSRLNTTLFGAISKLRDLGRYVGTMFNLIHEDESGKFNQVVFLYLKDLKVESIISNCFPGLVWSPII